MTINFRKLENSNFIKILQKFVILRKEKNSTAPTNYAATYYQILEEVACPLSQKNRTKDK